MRARHLGALCASLLWVMASASVADAYQFTYQCRDGSGAIWSRLPVHYSINSAGSSRFTLPALEALIADSFGAWGEPCCSRFSAVYDGTTSSTALNKPAGKVVLSWEESRWPGPQSYYGDVNSTIAVTLLSFANDCTIAEAPILFNAVGFRFTDQCNASSCASGGTDLQSVATHEIGHLLGLDHSNINGTTMYAYNLGGDQGRSLHQDDINGVCALYNQACGCQTNAQCAAGEQCVGGQCQRPSCTQTGCDPGLVCDAGSGDCITPPCTSDAQCGADYQCSGGRCVTRCAVCRDCTQTADCGARAACVDFNEDGLGECVVACGSDGSCPGDSECFQIPYLDQNNQQQVTYLCLNAAAEQGDICPDTYVCRDAPVVDPCQNKVCGAGEVCQAGSCVSISPPDMGAPDMSAPDMAVTTPDMSSPGEDMASAPDMGTGGGMEPEEEDALVIISAPSSSSESACLCASPGAPAPRSLGGAWLLGLVGLVAWRRRR
jgi:MYXO-CTERM domain-containing protein